MMNEQWKQFLVDNGAVIDDDVVQHFGNPRRECHASQSGSVFADLSHLGLLQFSGEDAASFLQGQLTNDIKQVTPQQGQLTGYCNPQGRLLALGLMFKRADNYVYQLPANLMPETQQRLQKFILRSKVTLSALSDELVCVGLSGAQCQQQLAAEVSALPTEAYATVTQDGLSIIRLPGVHARFMLVGETSQLQTLWSKLDVQAAPVGRESWELLDIQAGLATIYPETLGAFVPQMVNMHAQQGLNYQKGCYTGQEVIARLHYRGRLKRRMYLAQCDSCDAAPQPGDLIYPAEVDGQTVGNVVRCSPAPDGGYALLAVIVIEQAQSGQLHIGSTDGPVLSLLDLPYDLPEELT